MTYLQDRLKHINAGRPLPEKKKYVLNKVSPKRAAKEEAQKELLKGDEDTIKEKFFRARRKEMSGICQCCGKLKSSKDEDLHFRSSIAHIFPKKTFTSIQYHKLNWVERNFWDGHHSNMDNQGMGLWPKFKDWESIREKFFVLSPLLTDEERATKFYSHLERLVYKFQT